MTNAPVTTPATAPGADGAETGLDDAVLDALLAERGEDDERKLRPRWGMGRETDEVPETLDEKAAAVLRGWMSGRHRSNPARGQR